MRKASLTAGSRIQWTGTDSEKPVTHTFSIHSPLAVDRVAVGASFISDKIGSTNRNMFMMSGAYRIPVGLGKLSFGMSGGIMTFNSEPVDARDADDPLNQNLGTITRPEIGAGIFYYSDRFFFGLSIPSLMNNSIDTDDATMPYFDFKRHIQDMLSNFLKIFSLNQMFCLSLLKEHLCN